MPLKVELNSNGSIRRLWHEDISLTLFPGNELEGGPANLYLRRHADELAWVPLLGPRSPTRFAIASSGLTGSGSWLGIEYLLELRLAADATLWFWHLWLANRTATPVRLDLTYAQDLALASYGAVRMNEYYVSQYVDHTPLRHEEHGWMIGSRQNLAAAGRYPWCLIGSLRTASTYATDAMQLHGLAARAGHAPVGLLGELPGQRLQHEHSMVVIRDAAVDLPPQGHTTAGFFGCYLPDHPEATSVRDLERVREILAAAEAAPGAGAAPAPSSPPAAAPLAVTPAAANLFGHAPLLEVYELDAGTLAALFGSQRRHEELDADGQLLSFFCGADHHVVMRRKELQVRRPHGQLLRTGRHLTPDESGLTSTVWMNGVFHSLLTQGHVSINRFLSTVRGYLGLDRSHGQRVFVEIGGAWQLLGVPSAFEMAPDACRWIYRHAAGLIEVRAEARSEPHELTLSIETGAGVPVRCLIAHHVALNGDDGAQPGAARWREDAEGINVFAPPGSDVGQRFPTGSFQLSALPGTRFERIGGDELLFTDARTREQPYVCVVTAPAPRVGVRIRGHLIEQARPAPLVLAPGAALTPTLEARAPAGEPAMQATRLAEIVPWLTQNALVHYLSPRGLEQYSGGGWGTRDVCQGPVEMLLALARTAPIRDLLLRVMSAQNADGDWPQWFMFFEREREIRPSDSHGDVVFWPLLVLAQYLIASGDAGVLDERVPFYAPRGAPETNATVWQHAERALGLIGKRVIRGTALAAYGHGDWNDSLQPVDPRLRDRLCSAWTVTLHFQTLTTLARALRSIGRALEAAPLEAAAEAVRADFQRLLIVDGVLAGYALFEDDGSVRYLLHPRDEATGVTYSALAMVHAILEDLLTPAQVREHLSLIDAHLSGPDGLRLFDRPLPYHGGLQRLFQRAESAAFFGREIGLMYTHAHLRYAQALAHLGEAERFFRALCQANPIAIAAVVARADRRQANCYFSSSDAAFADRYQASAEYERIVRGTIALDGGWRVYSSGAGIALGLIMRRFLGLDCEHERLRLDPVMPRGLDGLQVRTSLLDRPLEVHYHIAGAGRGVHAVALNGAPLAFERAPNPHRCGAALIGLARLRQTLSAGANVLRVDIG